MSTFCHISQINTSKNVNQKRHFLNIDVKNEPKILNLMQIRKALKRKSYPLLRRKGCTRDVFDFFLDNANNYTAMCWHSVATIAKEISCSERSVIRATNELVKMGLIIKRQRGRQKNGKNFTNIYKINLELVGITSPSSPSNSIEVTTVVRQSSTKNNKSNFNNELLTNVKKVDPKKHIPHEQIDVERFFPDRTAYDLLKNITSPCNWDIYLSDLRAFIKEKQRLWGRPMKRFEANYAAHWSFRQTKKFWTKHEGKYIPLAKRLKYKQDKLQKPINVISYDELSKRLSEEAIKNFSKEELEYMNTLQ